MYQEFEHLQYVPHRAVAGQQIITVVIDAVGGARGRFSRACGLRSLSLGRCKVLGDKFDINA
jgi:hypothetical protein